MIKTIKASILVLIVWLVRKGKINTSSTSKTKKIKATKKNRKENGIRGNVFGVNPHSKGLNFSRSWILFLDRVAIANNNNSLNNSTMTKKIIKLKIL